MAHKPYVLIIEDEAPVRKVLRNELEKHNVTIQEAQNGEEALDIARAIEPKVIMLDFLMPKMHGIQFMQKLDLEKWRKNTSVIVLTNLPDDPRLVELEKQGLCKVLSKATASLDDIVREVTARL